MFVDPVIVTAMGTAVTGMGGFIVYLIKYVLADKEKQIKEMEEDRDQWIATAMTCLRATEPLAHAVLNQATENEARPHGGKEKGGKGR
jgi:hypothetical protein